MKLLIQLTFNIPTIMFKKILRKIIKGLIIITFDVIDEHVNDLKKKAREEALAAIDKQEVE